MLAVPFEPVLELFERNPRQLWNVTRLLAGRLRATDEALADSVFLDVTGRTAKRLLELSDGADEFVLPVTQEELAGMVGASRERVNKAIASFIRLGWLEQHDRNYRIAQARPARPARPLTTVSPSSHSRARVERVGGVDRAMRRPCRGRGRSRARPPGSARRDAPVSMSSSTSAGGVYVSRPPMIASTRCGSPAAR